MYTFIFNYENGAKNTFEHIVRIYYSRAGSGTTVEGDKLLSHNIPTGCTLHLFSKDSSFTIVGNNLSYIEVKKED